MESTLANISLTTKSANRALVTPTLVVLVVVVVVVVISFPTECKQWSTPYMSNILTTRKP